MNPLSFPKLDQYINDFSGVLPEARRIELNEVFTKHEQQTTEQVVVVLFPHRQGHELLDIGLKLFNENGIGQKNLNNGLLLIIATEEKKIRIITGKGMELKYPEMRCREIIENSLRPLLNEGRYEELLTTWHQLVTSNQTNIEGTRRTTSTKANDTIAIIFAIEVFTLIFGGTFIDGVVSGIIGVLIGAPLLYGVLWFLRERSFLMKFLISIIPVGFIIISILAIIAPAKCTLTESNIITGEESYSCEREIFGYKNTYTVTYGGSSSSSSSNSDWGDSSSSSFGGGGGSSNGGGWGD